MNRAALVAGAVSLLAVAGCGTKRETQAGGTPAAAAGTEVAAVVTPEARQEAQQIFGTRCAVCHGTTGHGDGPGAAGLTPRPRNYHDSAWQDSVTDKEIETAIVYGGAAVGRSPMMVGNPDLGNKPAVVAALREMVREFGKQK